MKDFFEQIIWARFKPSAGVRSMSKYNAGSVLTAQAYNKLTSSKQRGERIGLWFELILCGGYLLLVAVNVFAAPTAFATTWATMTWWLQIIFVVISLFVLYQFLKRQAFLRWAYKSARRVK